MADPKRQRQLKIQTGVVKRYTKEYLSYEKEVIQENERLEKMIAKGEDEYRQRKQKEVIAESQGMVPETLGRMKKAKTELNKLLETEIDLKDTEEYKDAQKIVEEANKVEVNADKE